MQTEDVFMLKHSTFLPLQMTEIDRKNKQFIVNIEKLLPRLEKLLNIIKN